MSPDFLKHRARHCLAKEETNHTTEAAVLKWMHFKEFHLLHSRLILFLLSEVSFTNIHESQDCRAREEHYKHFTTVQEDIKGFINT